MLAGMKVKNGREFERLVRAAAAKNGFVKGFNINFDVAKAADGTAIHRIERLDWRGGAEVAKRFGKTSLFFAFRDDAVLASFGESGLAPLQRSIEKFSGPHAAGSDEPVSAVIHAAGFGGFAAKNEDEVRRATADAFRGEDAKRDRVHLGLTENGGGIRLRLAIDLAALKFLAVLGKQVHQ